MKLKESWLNPKLYLIGAAYHQHVLISGIALAGFFDRLPIMSRSVLVSITLFSKTRS
nr:hypothetical protein [Stomatobaculum longum]